MTVGIIMGSSSDWPTMKHAGDMLDTFSIPYEKKVVSAHRTPEMMMDYARTAKSRGIKVIIAGAGGAAHLPGMVASMTNIPVIGVPIESKAMQGLDSLLSIVQMPGWHPGGDDGDRQGRQHECRHTGGKDACSGRTGNL